MKNAFPIIKLSQPVNLWKKSYLYVENVDPAVDFINLPPYKAGPPAEPRANWGYKPKPVSADGAAAINRLRVLTEAEGLKASDLLLAFVAPGSPAPRPASLDQPDERAPRPVLAEYQGDAGCRGGKLGERDLRPQDGGVLVVW